MLFLHLNAPKCVCLPGSARTRSTDSLGASEGREGREMGREEWRRGGRAKREEIGRGKGRRGEEKGWKRDWLVSNFMKRDCAPGPISRCTQLHINVFN